MVQESFKLQNPRGLFGLTLILIFAFAFSGWLRRKNRKHGPMHPGVRVFSSYLHMQGFLYGILAVGWFVVLLAMSVKK